MIGLPKPNVNVLVRQGCQRLLDRCIVFGDGLVLVGASGDSYDLTRLANTQLFLLNQVTNRFPFLRRRYSFFSIRFFMARFSILSSAYIFFNSACSASRSFSRLTSEASLPPYFDF